MLSNQFPQHVGDILLVDDHPIVQEGFKHMLNVTWPRLRFHSALSYHQGFEACQGMVYDLVLVDINLGGLKNGLDLLKALRLAAYEKKVVMLSGIVNQTTVEECIKCGASGFLSKNVRSEALLSVMNDILCGNPNLPFESNPSEFSEVESLTKTPFDLSPRLAEVLYYLCQGLSNKLIARRMNITEGTVRKLYVTELFRHYKVPSRTELIAKIARLGYQIPAPKNDLQL